MMGPGFRPPREPVEAGIGVCLHEAGQMALGVVLPQSGE
jgi:hypothetical protein